jgi:hypothetical protein
MADATDTSLIDPLRMNVYLTLNETGIAGTVRDEDRLRPCTQLDDGAGLRHQVRGDEGDDRS